MAIRRLWHDVVAHRLAAALILIVWLAIWIPALLGADVLVLLQIPLNLTSSGLVASWRMPPAGSLGIVDDSIQGGDHATLLSGQIDAVLMIVGIAKYSLQMGLWPALEARDVLMPLVMFPSFALVLGAIGSFIGLAITSLLRRLRGRGGPSAPMDIR